jgi:hypothetical protein
MRDFRARAAAAPHHLRVMAGAAVVVAALLLQPAAAQEAGPRDLPGWQNTRWGMTEKDLAEVPGLRLEKLPEQNHLLKQGSDERYAYADYYIPDFELVGGRFEVEFFMDVKTNGLRSVYFSPVDSHIRTLLANAYFEGLDQALTQKYGQPNFRNDSTDRGVKTRSRQWSFPSTVIELKLTGYSSVGMSSLHLEYKPSGKTDADKL